MGKDSWVLGFHEYNVRDSWSRNYFIYAFIELWAVLVRRTWQATWWAVPSGVNWLWIFQTMTQHQYLHTLRPLSGCNVSCYVRANIHSTLAHFLWRSEQKGLLLSLSLSHSLLLPSLHYSILGISRVQQPSTASCTWWWHLASYLNSTRTSLWSRPSNDSLGESAVTIPYSQLL